MTAVEATVHRHITELRQMAADGLINDQDHDTVGRILCSHIGHLIGVSTFAWDAFKRFVDESRKVHYEAQAQTTTER